MKYTRVRGTRDLIGEEAARVAYLESLARDMFTRYGFREIRTPVFELAEVFQRSVGEATDIVEKEMYLFADRKGRQLALRPEGTAGVVRAAIENNLFRDLPGAKLFYMGSMFRYERPQAGRYREFIQIGAEYFGTDRPEADAEVVSLAWDLLEAAGLSGSRVELASLGCAADREKYRAALTAFLDGVGGLCEDCERRKIRNPLRVLDCKLDGERLTAAPSIETHLCGACRTHFGDVRGCLDEMEIPAVLNWRLVRGLDYYTRTVFEIRMPSTPGTVGPAQDALAAGGRYDALVAEMGGPPIPGVGMALGVDRVLEALSLRLVDLPIGVEKDVFVASAGAVSRGLVLRILRELRHSRLSADIVYDEKSLKSQMSLADKLKAKYVVILGEMEVRKGVATLRDMRTKEQKEVNLREVAPWLVKRLRPGAAGAGGVKAASPSAAR